MTIGPVPVANVGMTTSTCSPAPLPVTTVCPESPDTESEVAARVNLDESKSWTLTS